MPRIPLISVIDDDDALRSSLENLIRSVGWRVRCFSSAEAFLKSNQMHETGCLILDVRMRGMSGLELQRQMVVANAHTPIIFITAHATPEARKEAMRAGAIAFLSKPFSEESLLNSIRLALEN